MKTITTALLVMLACFSQQAQAALLSLQIVDSSNLPAVDVVAYAEPLSEQSIAKQPHSAQIEQRSRKFAPLVTVVQVGSAVSFPNHDTVRHQVYSFSPTKVFELKLYSGAGGTPIIFDKAGTVVIGCNIHDQMTAYIQVVDTPYFGKSDASGKIVIENIPTGKYHLKIWHPTMALAPAISMKDLSIAASDNTMSFAVPFKTDRK
jgi:plastocyanin